MLFAIHFEIEIKKITSNFCNIYWNDMNQSYRGLKKKIIIIKKNQIKLEILEIQFYML